MRTVPRVVQSHRLAWRSGRPVGLMGGDAVAPLYLGGVRGGVARAAGWVLILASLLRVIADLAR